METNLLYILIALNVAVLALCIFFVVRLNLIKYLLEQPAVQKVSPKLKLRPYKPQESDKEVTTSAPAQSRPRSGGGNKSRDRSSNRDRSSRQRTQQRGPRSRGPRAQFPNRSDAQANGAKEQHNESRDAAPKQSSHGGGAAEESKGRRPLMQEREAPQPQQVQPVGANGHSNTPETKDNDNIRHGRRTRVKKAPTFEE